MNILDDIKTIKAGEPFTFTYINRNGEQKERTHLFPIDGNKLCQAGTLDITDLDELEKQFTIEKYQEYLQFLSEQVKMTFEDFCHQTTGVCVSKDLVKYRNIKLERITSIDGVDRQEDSQ